MMDNSWIKNWRDPDPDFDPRLCAECFTMPGRNCNLASPVLCHTEADRDSKYEKYLEQVKKDCSMYPRPETYKVEPGDCLRDIAIKFYGDPGKWALIYYANRETFNFYKQIVEVGQVLKLPCSPCRPCITLKEEGKGNGKK